MTTSVLSAGVANQNEKTGYHPKGVAKVATEGTSGMDYYREWADEYFIIKSQQVETDALDGLADDASFTKIKNSFVKGAKSLKTSRMVLGRVIDLVA